MGYYKDVESLIKKLHIKVALLKINGNGFAINEYHLIVINSQLPPYSQLSVLLHELGHFVCQNDILMYCRTYVAHQKAEYDANHFMIECLLDWYVKTADIEISDVNYCNFAMLFNLNVDTVREVLKEELNTRA